MTIPTTAIAVGRCYAAAINRVLQVIKIQNGTVTYQEKMKTESGGSSLTRSKIGIEKFAHLAKYEVPCD
jgi:hypothetical protein